MCRPCANLREVESEEKEKEPSMSITCVYRVGKGRISLQLALVLLMGFAALAGGRPLTAQPVCTVLQVTETEVGSSGAQDISADGETIVFVSTVDPETGAALPLGQRAIFGFAVSTGDFSHILTIPGGLEGPRVNRDGSRIVFSSGQDLVPGKNTDGNFEVFLQDLGGQQLRQITETTVNRVGQNLRAVVSGNGKRIAFSSNAEPVPGGNPEGWIHIFLFDDLSGTMTQLTNQSQTRNDFPSISDDGQWLAIESSSNLQHPGNQDGNREIFLYDVASDSFLQITNTFGGTTNFPEVSGNGNFVAFSSRHDLVPGSNPGGEFQVFLFERQSATTRQITDAIGVSASPPRLSFSADGSRLCLSSGEDFEAGGNPDGNLELFCYEPLLDRLFQLTQTTNCTVGTPRISGAGTRIALSSNCDLVGGKNIDGNSEVFLMSCTPSGLEVLVDLKPGSDPNCVNPHSKGRVPVAVLGSSESHAAGIDIDSLEFGGASPVRCSLEDVQPDGFLDLVCHYRGTDIGWPNSGEDCGVIPLSGLTTAGIPIRGGDVACLAGEVTCEEK